ncbi:MAG TPA: serine/threonine protein kinase, partial [Actinophytocola sp.]|nr:serine/threonine protein kinase [Actinophytocola sp.]
ILVGSPTYMAPERIKGAEADAGSDLWALAAVLFYAVEGYSPFERTSTAATMHAIVNEVPYLTRCQGPLASVIMGLLNSTPQARLSATQVRGLLAQATNTPALGTQTVPAGYNGGTAMLPGAPPTHLTTGQNRPRRTGLLVAALVSVLLAGAAGGWFGGRALLAGEQPVDDAKGATMSYGLGGGTVEEFALGSGNCSAAQLRPGRSYPSGSNSDCASPHDFEVYDSDDFDTAVSEYPGESYMKTYAEGLCAMFFRTSALDGADRDTLSFATLYPTKMSWDEQADDDSSDGGDRSVYCVITNRDPDRQLDSQQFTTS